MQLLRASIPTTIAIRTNLVSDAVVVADPSEIHRIIVNLCTNAALAMKEEGGTLTVGLDDIVFGDPIPPPPQGLEPGRYVRLTVADTGCGMSEEVKAHIFEPFYTTRAEGGTGMGLAVVHGVIRNRGGAVFVESSPGKGSTFRVFLPVAEMNSESSDPLARDAECPSGTERVLFVDDEMDISAVAEQGLGQLGYTVTAVNSSREALDLFKADPAAFDVLVTDMTMPGMTGDVLAAEILKIRPDLPVVFCTGYSERLGNVDAGEGKAVEFALKPFSMADLSRLIRKLLD